MVQRNTHKKSGEGGKRNSENWLALIFLSWIGVPDTDDSTQGV